MNNIDYFKKQVKYWSKKFRLGNIEIIPDPHMWFVAFVNENFMGKYMWYNSNLLRYMTKDQVMRLVFHELGHFKHPFFHVGKYEYWEYLTCEYMAEKQMFTWLKKYYPKYYKMTLKNMKARIQVILSYPKKYKYYFEAFSQIPEYAEHL